MDKTNVNMPLGPGISDVQEYDLGDVGLDYVRSRLEWGDEFVLSRFLLELPLQSGRVWTFLPAGLPRERMLRITDGGIWPSEVILRDGVPWRRITKGGGGTRLAQFVCDYVVGSAQRLMLFQDANARRADGWLESYAGPVVFHGEHVYHHLYGDGLTPDRVEEVESNASSLWLAMRVLVDLPGWPNLQNRQEVSTEFIQAVAAGADHIIIEAYDGEGDVVWSKR